MTISKAEQKHEAEVVELMMQANAHAKKLFGELADVVAVESIFDRIDQLGDEEQVVEDLGRMIEHCKAIYDTPTPSPDQVFMLFDKAYPEDEEEGDEGDK